jgi:hypothetical protein
LQKTRYQLTGSGGWQRGNKAAESTRDMSGAPNRPETAASPACGGRAIGRVLSAAVGLTLLGIAYHHLLRARVVNWGATPDEVAAHVPGDELLSDAQVVATRVITINAQPEAIWPWLVQMGVGRGGAYTYDWIEQLLGLDMHSADRILPEFQQLKVGDVLPLRPNDPGMRIEILDPGRAMSSRSEDGNWVWSFALVPENGSTRLMSRYRARVRTKGERVAMAAMEIGSLVMERRMLRGIKERAERISRGIS